MIAAEEPAEPAAAGRRRLQTGSGIGGPVRLEALPIVGKLAGEEHLAGEERLGLARRGLHVQTQWRS